MTLVMMIRRRMKELVVMIKMVVIIKMVVTIVMVMWMMIMEIY